MFGAEPAGPGAPLGMAALEMRGCGTGWGYGEGAAADQPCSTGVQEPWPSIRRIGDRFPHRGPAGSTPCPPGTRECPDGTGQGPDHRGHRNGQDHRSGCRPRHTAPLGTHRAGMPAARRRTAGDRARHRRRPVAHRYRIAPAHRARGRFTADGGGGRGSPRAPPGTTSPDDGARTGPATNLARSTSGCRAPARLHRGTAVPHSCGFRQGTGSRASGQGGPHRAGCAASTNPLWTPCS